MAGDRGFPAIVMHSPAATTRNTPWCPALDSCVGLITQSLTRPRPTGPQRARRPGPQV
jgi:hypothetical protein